MLLLVLYSSIEVVGGVLQYSLYLHLKTIQLYENENEYNYAY